MGNEIVIVASHNGRKEHIMIIGTFEYNAATDLYFGEVLFIDRKVHLKPVKITGDKGPDYRIGTSAEFGDLDLGAGWKRMTEGGEAFVSVSMDSPVLPEPLNAALFLDEGGEFASLVWTRSQAKPKAKAA
jgi:uncharacterized protein (DUF736 family)